MGGWRNSTETQQLGHIPRSGPEVKNGIAVEARMRGSQGGESDPAEGVRTRCMKNSPSVLSCIGKRTKEGCDCGGKVEKVHSR